MIDKSNANHAKPVDFEDVKQDFDIEKLRTENISGTAINKGQFDLMWQFLMMGQQKSNVPALKELCESLRQMMMQKTGGQRKDKPKDVPFEDLSTILCGIVIESMTLYLSGDLDKIGDKIAVDK